MTSIIEKSGVVPDVIDTVPKDVVQVRYPSGVEVNLDNQLTPTSAKDAPTVKWAADKGAYYTLAMVDPDAPSRKEPTKREIKHWLVVNIPDTDVSKGEVLASYIGPGPPQGSGLHRYILLVYKQSAHLTFNESAGGDRANFKIRDFAKKYQLGEPIAANFFEAQYEGKTGSGEAATAPTGQTN